jgi:hypothetical protein
MGGAGGASSSYWSCTAGDCYNYNYECRGATGYQRVRTLYCSRELVPECGSNTCNTLCVKDGDPVSCPPGTVCVWEAWGKPEKACRPTQDSGVGSVDSGVADVGTKEAGSD